MRIAMWSGPRNLSTALMYAFSARGDFAVWDEPFYGAYLRQTGVQHPLRETILSQIETDPIKIAERHLGAIPQDKPHFYFKEMTHHILPDTPKHWFSEVSHVFLIRHPARVIRSYLEKRQNPSEQDIGFIQQLRLFDKVARSTGQTPIVVDAADIRANPEAVLGKLCAKLGLSYSAKMLSWPAGGNASDGPWAEHWYGSAWRSTGFAETEGPVPLLPKEMQPLLSKAMPIYELLKSEAI